MKKVLLRVMVKGKQPSIYRSFKIRSFSKRIPRLIKWQTEGLKVYLKVFYGKQKDNHGKLVEFFNDGNFTNKADFDAAYQGFITTD